jgi:hypothetical protein
VHVQGEGYLSNIELWVVHVRVRVCVVGDIWYLACQIVSFQNWDDALLS